jgi:hypothetical protein
MEQAGLRSLGRELVRHVPGLLHGVHRPLVEVHGDPLTDVSAELAVRLVVVRLRGAVVPVRLRVQNVRVAELFPCVAVVRPCRALGLGR